jgi:hypothetical protein
MKNIRKHIYNNIQKLTIEVQNIFSSKLYNI